MSYLPVFSKALCRYFYGHLPSGDWDPAAAVLAEAMASNTLTLDEQGPDKEIWYDVGGVPLKWHYPIGLLYDLHAAQALQLTSTSPLPTVPPNLPWHLTLHISNFPSDKLFRSITPADHFMAQLKETDHIRNGSAKRIMALSKKDQTALWRAVVEGDHDMYWEINRKILLGSSSLEGGSGTATPTLPTSLSAGSLEEGETRTGMPRQVPVRVYCVGRLVMQEVVTPLNPETGRDLLLGDLLSLHLPDLFPTPLPPTTPLTVSAVVPALAVLKPSPETISIPRAIAIVQGIAVPLDAPVLWLSRNLAHADMFLHVVVAKVGEVGESAVGELRRWVAGVVG
ncbi:autophagy protein 5 [Phlyctochytrium bullatum]|nr:autophagy protein 5 [Phlyctochytrium bullatum]